MLVSWKLSFDEEPAPVEAARVWQPSRSRAPSTPSIARRRRRRLQHPSIDAELAKALQVPHIPPHQLLALARLCLSGSIQDASVADLVFTLLAVLHQQILAHLGLAHALESLHPQVPIGIAEMLLAALVTMDLRHVQLSAHQLVESPVFTSRAARREYFGACIHTTTAHVQQSLSRRPWPPPISASFLSYCSARLLQELTGCTLSRESDGRSLWLVVDAPSTRELLRQAEAAKERLQLANGTQGASPHRVALGLAAYWLLCDALTLESFTMDVLHLVTLERHTSAVRREWLQTFCSRRQPPTEAQQDALGIVNQATAFASAAGSLPDLLQLSLELRVDDVELYERVLLTVIARGSDETQRHDLRAIAFEWLLAAAIAELRQLPVLPPESQDAPLDLEAFVRRLRTLKQATAEDSDRVVTHARVVIALLTEHLGASGVANALREALLVDAVWTPSTTEHDEDSEASAMTQVRRLLIGTAVDAAKCAAADGDYRGVVRVSVSADRSSRDAQHRGLVPQALRTLSALVWCLWTRHSLARAWYASDHCTAASIAVCALQLNVWTPFRDDVDEIRGLQLTLLERAAQQDAETTARVLAWGFPPEAIHARLLKRYKALRSAVAQSCAEPLDALARRLELLRRRLRGLVLPRPEHSPDRARQERDARWWTSKGDVDAFLDGCCSAELQRVAWALAGHRFSVVPVQPDARARRTLVDGAVTRRELAALLQRQKEELEQRLQRVTGLLSEGSHEKKTVEEATQPDARAEGESDSKPRMTVDFSGPSLETKGRAKRLTIRELEEREEPAVGADIPDVVRPRSERDENRPLRKGSSCQNVLKLLQLRKDTSGSSAGEVKRRQSSSATIPGPLEASFSEPRAKPLPKAVVAPLRLPVASADGAAVTLLRTASQRRAVPLKPRAFAAALQTRRPLDIEPHNPPVSAGTQCVIHKTTSAQTDTLDYQALCETAEEQLPQSPLKPSVDASTETPAPPVAAPETRDATSQCGLSVAPSSASALAAVATRFPISVNLKESGKQQPFLRITKLDVASSRRSIRRGPSPGPPIETRPETPPAAEPAPVTPPTEGDRDRPQPPEPAEEGDADAAMARRRQLYREHFAGSKAPTRPQRRATGDSLSTIKTEMERMKQKLSELETCAADIEEGFRSTYHSLESFQRPRGGRPSTIVEVDEVLEHTSSQRKTRGATLLSVKAASDLDAARRLLEQIDTVTSRGEATTEAS
ncbi:hypothetical protein ATCC90586_009924 [Pythium insidiosum]|nr:hypothetical protein ATCC90586_009924 [Pythium insidiosum]